MRGEGEGVVQEPRKKERENERSCSTRRAGEDFVPIPWEGKVTRRTACSVIQ